MTKTSSIAKLAPALALLLGAAPALADYIQGRHTPASKYVEGELIVKYRPESSVGGRVTQSLAAHGGQKIKSIHDASLLHVKLPHGRNVADSIEEYNRDPDVEYVQPNYIRHAFAGPFPKDLPQLWAYQNTGGLDVSTNNILLNTPQNWPEGWIYGTNNPTPNGASYDMGVVDTWTFNTDCSNSVVAVVDTGVNYNNSNLAPNMWAAPPTAGRCPNGALPIHGCDFVANTNTPLDYNGHGTHVAGTIGAAGSAIIQYNHSGVCWNTQIMAIRVLDAQGSGNDVNIAAGILYAAQNGAKVINLSLGGPGVDPVYDTAIGTQNANGGMVIAAAGNDGSDNDFIAISPCDNLAPNLMCVAAVDQSGLLAFFSNFGSFTVNVGAPGVNILSTYAGIMTEYYYNFTNSVCGGNWKCAQVAGSTGAGWSFNNGTGQMLDQPENPNTNDYNATIFCDPNFANLSFTTQVAGNVQSAGAFCPSFAASGTASTFMMYGSQNLGGGDDLNFYIGNIATPAMAPTQYDPLGTVIDPTRGVAGGTYLFRVDGTYDYSGSPLTADISNIVAGSADGLEFGTQLVSAAGSTGGGGVVITQYQLNQLVLDQLVTNPASYNILNGTSQATPHVAGLAAMLFSFNPNFKTADVINAIYKGGISQPSLQGTTTSGKAVNAFYSMLYITPPKSPAGSIPF